VRRSALSPRLCGRCAEGARAVAAAEGSEARIRGELYGRTATGAAARGEIVDAFALRESDRIEPI
jgi:hypothetical protein